MLLLLGSAVPPAKAVVHSAPALRAHHWRRVHLPNEGGGALAVALQAGSGRLAVGDAQGLLLQVQESGRASDPVAVTGRWRRFAGTGPVRDLHFDVDGGLWIAGDRGLWLLDARGRLSPRVLAPGDEEGRVRRITGAAGLLVASTAGGAFVSADGESWRRILDGVPRGAVRAAAVRAWQPATGADPRDVRMQVWLLVTHEVWRLELGVTDGELWIGPARRPAIPGRPASQTPSDIVIDLAGAELAVLYPRAIARILPGRIAEARWEVAYPVLPPGAVALRLHAADHGVWLATDQGLLHGAALPGPWERESSPAGTAPVFAVAGDGERVYAATSIGLLEGRPAAPRAPSAGLEPAPGTPHPRPRLPIDPDLRTVHQRAIEYSGLEPSRFRDLERGLARRGWLPVMSLRAGAAYDRDTSDDHDETFTYGELHQLQDRSSARSRDFEGTITLAWDFADLAYPTEAPDLSREARQVVTLRDNVLDEVTQLYFDRRRALIALGAFADRRDPEAVALEIRSRELAAGLDAWTGGWFSRHVREPVP
ncbi:MAG: hypothetical protein JRG92_00405 [Deltaproteobacteria bacterium]|nr:hypothetical protein [Deltaproteobacteria bacterium]